MPAVILPVIQSTTQNDWIYIAKTLPVFTGDEADTLLCGRCTAVIGESITVQQVRERHPNGARVVVKCICMALNLAALATPLAPARRKRFFSR
jgi:hypothetical protein